QLAEVGLVPAFVRFMDERIAFALISPAAGESRLASQATQHVRGVHAEAVQGSAFEGLMLGSDPREWCNDRRDAFSRYRVQLAHGIFREWNDQGVARWVR
ncbi:MAG: hypothetical protein R3B96_25695, partial [Pirellulaceae bacterium]